MTPSQITACGFVLLLVAFLLWQWRERRRTVEIARLAQAGSRFHCIEVRARGKPCAAAQAVAGKRFLSSTAPPIPLPGCTSMTCRCAYMHFEDRRVGDRRDPYVRRHEDAHEEAERRRRADRRRKPGLRTIEAY